MTLPTPYASVRISFALMAAPLACWLLTACSTTTVYIVRHAEKVNETDSTDLSPVGRQRADALADSLTGRGIDSILTTPYRRTRQTAQPLARRVGIQLVDYPASPIREVVNRINRMRHKTVVVVGHSNTILDIAGGLGARPTLLRIESGDYDNLLRVQIRRRPFGKSVHLSQTTYGRLTPPN